MSRQPGTVVNQRQSDGVGGEEKRHREQQVGAQQPERLPGIPEYLLGIEGNLLRKQETADRR